MDIKNLTKLEKVFIKLVDFVAKGEITAIYIDAYDDGTRKATIHWKKGKKVEKLPLFRNKILTLKAMEKPNEKNFQKEKE